MNNFEEITALLTASIEAIAKEADSCNNLFSIRDRFNEILSHLQEGNPKIEAFIERKNLKAQLTNASKLISINTELRDNLEKINKLLDNGTI